GQDDHRAGDLSDHRHRHRRHAPAQHGRPGLRQGHGLLPVLLHPGPGGGLAVAHVVRPGEGMNIDPAELDGAAVEGYVQQSHEMTLVGFLLDVIPDTLVGAFVGGNILQVLFIAVLFGIALAMVGERGRPVQVLLDALTAPVFRLVHILMKAAPIGAFGAIAFTIGKYGVSSLASLAWLVGVFYLTSLLFVLVVLGAVCRLCGFSILKLARYLRAELLLVLGTSSSESALPSLM